MPYKETRCTLCTHEKADELNEDRLVNRLSWPQLHKKYFPDEKPRTVQRKLRRHFKNHFNPAQVAHEIIVNAADVPPPCDGRSAQALSPVAQKIFNAAQKEHINATLNLEQMMRLLMEKINLLEEEFIVTYNATKCEKCNRGVDQGQNLSKILACVREVRELNGEWVKIKNPREVIKYHFNSSFVKFVDNMTAYYMETLQEKGRLIRQAVRDFIEGRINAQLLSRRVAEVEDLGAATIADKSVQQLRQILDDVGKEMEKGYYS